jgi:hypothetical protein
MKRVLTTLVAAALLALPAVPASAVPEEVSVGGCFFDAALTTHAISAYSGVLGVAAIVSIGSGITPAIITCEIRVNGVSPNPTTSGSWSGLGVVAGARETGFVLGADDTIELCQTVEFVTSGNTQSTCSPAVRVAVLSERVAYYGNTFANGVPAGLDNQADVILCVLLGAQAGTYGPITIEREGDVHGPSHVSKDCPPYGG